MLSLRRELELCESEKEDAPVDQVEGNDPLSITVSTGAAMEREHMELKLAEAERELGAATRFSELRAAAQKVLDVRREMGRWRRS